MRRKLHFFYKNSEIYKFQKLMCSQRQSKRKRVNIAMNIAMKPEYADKVPQRFFSQFQELPGTSKFGVRLWSAYFSYWCTFRSR